MLSAAGLSAAQVSTPDVDAAFSSFFHARTAQEVATASDRIVATGIGFDETLRRLRQGRVYSRDVPRGVVERSYRSGGDEYFYRLDVPENYDPARKYQVRIQLHGGVGRREDNRPPPVASSGRAPAADLTARLRGADQIYVMPYAWRSAPWWTRRQMENIRGILDLVKRSYNVDENRVVLSGVSDGGTGAYYAAMRDTTPFASFLPLNGFIMVLANETAAADGDLFPNNLLNKPLFVVNGGRDPLYPTSLVDPYVAHLKSAGVDLVYLPQAEAGHDTSWWPDVRDAFEQFVADHPRRPLPDALTWESGPPNIPSRAHWMVIERTRPAERPDGPPLPDVNRMSSMRPALDFGIRTSGTRVNRVISGSNAEKLGLRSGDVVVGVNNQPASPATDVADLLSGLPSGRPLLLSVNRGGELVRLTGRYDPAVLPEGSGAMFQRQRESARADLIRVGNSVEATTTGVAELILLLSPDQFDLNRPITVLVNGHKAFEGTVERDVRTLLKWAARDNDRTMLFAAELRFAVPR